MTVAYYSYLLVMVRLPCSQQKHKAGDTGSARSITGVLRGGDTASILLKSVKLTSGDDTAFILSRLGGNVGGLGGNGDSMSLGVSPGSSSMTEGAGISCGGICVDP